MSTPPPPGAIHFPTLMTSAFYINRGVDATQDEISELWSNPAEPSDLVSKCRQAMADDMWYRFPVLHPSDIKVVSIECMSEDETEACKISANVQRHDAPTWLFVFFPTDSDSETPVSRTLRISEDPEGKIVVSYMDMCTVFSAYSRLFEYQEREYTLSGGDIFVMEGMFQDHYYHRFGTGPRALVVKLCLRTQEEKESLFVFPEYSDDEEDFERLSREQLMEHVPEDVFKTYIAFEENHPCRNHRLKAWNRYPEDMPIVCSEKRVALMDEYYWDYISLYNVRWF